MPNWIDDNGYNTFQDGLEESLEKSWVNFKWQAPSKDIKHILEKEKILSAYYKELSNLNDKISKLRVEISDEKMKVIRR